MDSGISEMISSVLSNPDALSKIMNLMPAVAQMMNGGGSNNINNNNINNIVETTAVNKMSAENLMANAEVMAAFKNLINALNSASSNIPAGDAVPSVPPNNNDNNNENNAGNPEILTSGIEKTLDTFKNFSGAANPESDHRSKLLLALKPFLKDARQTKIDAAIKYMNAAKIITLFGKNGFV